jgi:hypothetical protein
MFDKSLIDFWMIYMMGVDFFWSQKKLNRVTVAKQVKRG